MKYSANVYPRNDGNTTITHSDPEKAHIGLCFSGGGSRALTCAWGQILGLRKLNLMEKARYISSVSGGTWASSIYSYLPDHISDEALLGTYYPPEDLSLTKEAGKLDMNHLPPYSLGHVPHGMSLKTLGEMTGQFLLTHKKKDHKWLWAYLVGRFVLKPYGLQSEGEHPWQSSKHFTLSKPYAKKFPQPSPPIDAFYFLRAGRPFPIMNNNIMEPCPHGVIQLPNQVTPVAGGAQGESPSGCPLGGGLVESYGVCSTLSPNASIQSPATVETNQPYSLIDIVSTSSAFFAEFLVSHVREQMTEPKKKRDFIQQIKANLTKDEAKSLLAEIKADISDLDTIIEKQLETVGFDDMSSLLGNIVPTYTYWPVRKESTNHEMGYTDGGSLDNTGILGMLAQTETGGDDAPPIRLLAFDNTSTPLINKRGTIIAAGQVAPLFGIDFDEKTGSYHPFTDHQKDPGHQDFTSKSLITVFDNQADSTGKRPFDKLVQGLYTSSCGASSGEKPEANRQNREPAFHQMALTTVDNSLSGVMAHRNVKFFYIQNAKMLAWQDRIGDKTLKSEIVCGQEASKDPFTPFKNFPYYSTGFKIGLEKKEAHALSQMWAWAISDEQSPLAHRLRLFMK